ncbi:MAG: aldose 1-epimerase family protein [Planctomycetota bacterium]
MAKRNEPVRVPLLDADESYRAAPGVVLAADTSGADGWAVGWERLRGGRQEGVDVVTVENGRFAFSVCPTRGMGILDAVFEGVRLGWDSPVAGPVHPAYVHPDTRGGLGWLDGFSEWFVRCGLAWNGAPSAVGPLHGRIANLPAEAVTVGFTPGRNGGLAVHGRVREATLFGANLLLETTLRTAPGADWITVEDRVTNLSAQPATMQMLYHINHGPPLLEADSRIVAPVETLAPRDPGQADRAKAWDRCLGPTTGLDEACLYADLRADRRGETRQLLHNAGRDLAVVQRYRKRSLPAFTLWKHEAALADGYVVGLEPGANYPNPAPYERAHGRAVRLRPGGTWTAAVTLSVAQGRKAVDREVRRVRTLQGKRRPALHLVPQPDLSPAGDAAAEPPA